MENINSFDRERELARLCLKCIYGNAAQPEHGAARGLAYTCVKNFPKAECPFWEIYQMELRTHEPSATAASESRDREFSAPVPGVKIISCGIYGTASE